MDILYHAFCANCYIGCFQCPFPTIWRNTHRCSSKVNFKKVFLTTATLGHSWWWTLRLGLLLFYWVHPSKISTLWRAKCNLLIIFSTTFRELNLVYYLHSVDSLCRLASFPKARSIEVFTIIVIYQTGIKLDWNRVVLSKIYVGGFSCFPSAQFDRFYLFIVDVCSVDKCGLLADRLNLSIHNHLRLLPTGCCWCFKHHV